jgi:hypothetical protein
VHPAGVAVAGAHPATADAAEDDALAQRGAFPGHLQAEDRAGLAAADPGQQLGEPVAVRAEPAGHAQVGTRTRTDRATWPLSGIAARSPVPVRLMADLHGRAPAAIEAVAYFVVSEALTNVAKHATATRADVVVRRQPGGLAVAVADDSDHRRVLAALRFLGA